MCMGLCPQNLSLFVWSLMKPTKNKYSTYVRTMELGQYQHQTNTNTKKKIADRCDLQGVQM